MTATGTYAREDPGGAPARILVADDDVQVRQMLTSLLRRRWRVNVAEDGEVAWNLAVNDPPDLVVSDVMMPNVDGISLLRRLRADPRTQNVPVILISARAGEDDTVSGIEAGADDYLVKPFSLRELTARVQMRLEITAMRERNAQQAEALAALRRQQGWTQLLFGSLPVPVLLIDPGGGQIRFANRAAVRMAGRPLEPGSTLEEAGELHRIDGAIEGPPITIAELAAGAGGELHDVLLQMHTSAGSFRVLADSVTLPGDGSREQVTILTLRDITSLAQREADLRTAVAARDEFLSVASHELRTPLTTLGLHVDGLVQSIEAGRAGADLPPGTARRLQGIRRQVTRVDELLERLLDVSRLVEGRLQLQPEAVDLIELAYEAVAALAPAAELAGCVVTVTGPPAVPGDWDRRRVLQVLVSLLSNAVKFGGGTPVDVEIADTGGAATVTVRDQGMGIPAEQHEKIFERFARLQPERHFPGMGLGLWSARHILAAFGGTISVASTPGQGAAFTVTLPRIAAAG